METTSWAGLQLEFPERNFPKYLTFFRRFFFKTNQPCSGWLMNINFNDFSFRGRPIPVAEEKEKKIGLLTWNPG